MKIIFSIFVMVILFSMSVICNAADPFANNKDFVKVFESNVPILYLDKNSVSVERYEPPIYEISCDTPLYDKYSHKAMRDGSRNLIRYNFDTKQVWIYNRSERRWYEQDINGVSKDYRRLFNEVFEIAYGMPFYGGIPYEKVAIGGLQLGNTREYVKSIYGEPDSDETVENVLELVPVQVWKYGQSLMIHFANGKIQRIVVSANNGLSTPDGLRVGMKEYDIKKIYGEPFSTKHDGFYNYRSPNFDWLLINTQNGSVSKITIGTHY